MGAARARSGRRGRQVDALAAADRVDRVRHQRVLVDAALAAVGDAVAGVEQVEAAAALVDVGAGTAVDEVVAGAAVEEVAEFAAVDRVGPVLRLDPEAAGEVPRVDGLAAVVEAESATSIELQGRVWVAGGSETVSPVSVGAKVKLVGVVPGRAKTKVSVPVSPSTEPPSWAAPTILSSPLPPRA